MGLSKKKQQQSSDDVIAPDDPDVMSNLGLLAHEEGDLDAARAWYEITAAIVDGRSVAISPEDEYAMPALALRTCLGEHGAEGAWPFWLESLAASVPSLPRLIARRIATASGFQGKIDLAMRRELAADLSLPLLGWRSGSRPGTHSWSPPHRADIAFHALLKRGALSSAALETIATHPFHPVLEALAKIEAAPDQAIEALARFAKPDVAIAICAREELPTAAHESLAMHKSPDVRFAFAANHAWDADRPVLAALARDRSPRTAAAVSRACPSEFAELAPDRRIQDDTAYSIEGMTRDRTRAPYRERWRAAHDELDTSYLKRLASHRDAIVRSRIVRRPDAPNTLVLQAAHDPSIVVLLSAIRSQPVPTAVELLRITESSVAANQDPEVADRETALAWARRALIERLDIDDDAVRSLLDLSNATHILLAERSDLPRFAISHLARHSDPYVREAIAERGDITKAIADELLGDEDDVVALTVLSSNASKLPAGGVTARIERFTPASKLLAALLIPSDNKHAKRVMTQLAEDADPRVRLTVATRPDLENITGSGFNSLIKALATDPELRIRTAVAARRDLPKAVRQLADKHQAEAARAAANVDESADERPTNSRPGDPKALPAELTEIAALSSDQFREEIQARHRGKDRSLDLVLQSAGYLPNQLQNLVTEVSTWVTTKGHSWGDDLADERSARRRELVRIQKLMLSSFPAMTPHAKRIFIRGLLPESATLLVEQRYDALSEMDRKKLRAHSNPRVAAAIQGREAILTTTGADTNKHASGVSREQVDAMTLNAVVRYVSDRVAWPDLVEHVLTTRVLEPTATSSRYKLSKEFDGMTELVIAIATNPEALRLTSPESIRSLLGWNTGQIASRGWDSVTSARQGDKWAVEEALARNRDVLPDEIIRMLEASTSRKVKAILREQNREPRASSTAISHATRASMSDDAFADAMAATDAATIQAVIANNDLLLAATPQQQADLARRADPKSARALATKAATLAPEAQVAIAKSRLFVARRALASIGPAALCDEARTILEDDDDEGVSKIVNSWSTAKPAPTKRTPSAAAKKPRKANAAQSGTGDVDARIAAQDQGDLLAIIADDALLKSLTPTQQVALAEHRSVDVPRALAKKAPLLHANAQQALASSRIFTARRELVRTAGKLLSPDLLESLAEDDDEVVRKIVEAIRRDA